VDAKRVESTACHLEGQQRILRRHPMLSKTQPKTRGRIPMSVDTIEKLFIAELKDLYSAENQITKALPKW